MPYIAYGGNNFFFQVGDDKFNSKRIFTVARVDVFLAITVLFFM